ncbi:MAG: DUF4007 family protein [Terracidiphilus sp.]
MRFSGHETFSIRDGWLDKGLSMLSTEPQKLFDEHAADYLGVGKNMAKSIRHWLQATRLAELDPDHKGRLRMTDVGRCVMKNDPYFTEPGTWWFLHINMVREPAYADTWAWFFNRFALERFERATVVENLRQFLQMTASNVPSMTTLDRDIACLLASYARPIPADDTDPEEARDCPFRELGLMTHFKTSGYYQIHRGVKPIPPQVFGYSLAATFEDAAKGTAMTDISLHDAAQSPGGPGRAFALNSESLFETALRIEAGCRHGEIAIVGHAGNRMIRVKQKPPLQWVEDYFASIKEVSDVA